MRRITVLFTTFIFSVSGLVSNPAQAAAPTNGTYLCTTGVASNSTPNFTITNGAVSAGESCVGDVVIPAGVKSIENSAFAVSGLTSIALPAGLVSIGQSAFSDTESLNSITIPASVKDIGDGAFRFAGLTSITVESANKNFISTSGVLFNKASTTIIAYPSNKDATSYSIPETVTSIGGTAFSAANLTDITIPSGVTSIGWCAFESTDITSINIPASVASIAEFAFDNTGSLSSITVDPANADYSSLGDVLFNEAATTLITYPSKRDATSYSIPETVTSIGHSAFQGASLTSITIPETVTSIANQAFSNSTLTSVTIPSSVTSIEYGIFYGASSLTSVTIPSSVTSIGDDAFRYTALTSVYFLGDAPATGSSSPFGDIPAGARAYIKSGASGFGNLGSIWNGLVVEEFSEIPTQTPSPAESNEVETPTDSGEGNSMAPFGVIGLVLLVLLAGYLVLRRRK